MPIRRLLFLLSFTLTLAHAHAATTFQVRHDHLIGSCTGDLVFAETGVEYRTDKTEDSRAWDYEDIQRLELTSRRITILSYEGRRIELGADREFHFEVLKGEVTDAFRRELETRLTRPLVSSVIPEQEHARYKIPARRKRLVGGGSQGVLELGERYLVFRAEIADQSQIWRYDDLESIGSTGAYQLRVDDHVFDLKRRLRPEEYDFLWEKVNLPAIRKR